MTAAVSFRDALKFWWTLGWISFGGPAGQIAIMHEELVTRRRWISEKRFLHALNYCMVLPGPEAQQLATYIGWLMHGTRGGLAAGALFVLPSLLILTALSFVYVRFGTLPAVAAMLWGLKPAVVAIVLAAALRIGRRALGNAALCSVALAAFVALALLHLPFPLVILTAAGIGGGGGRWRPDLFHNGGGPRHDGGSHAPALIDDDTPPPAHARADLPRTARQLAAGLLLGGGVLAVLWGMEGGVGLLTRMGLFFTQAALLTFGGAYAVLPYVFQAAVTHYGWLGASQMMAGLALGETTPGPLIMIVAFVGFVGGWAAGPGMALAGAGVATFFTFLPSFLFILIGGPLIEASHKEQRLTAPLTAITAAVVGVILSLAVLLGRQVLWPQGSTGAPDTMAVAITAAALLALIRFRTGVVMLILACAAAGLAWKLPGTA